jgi:hypothetical protein
MQEWARTRAWMSGWLGGSDERCWQGNNLASLTRLHDDFAKAEGLGAYERQLAGYLTADDATPIFGQTILAAGGWALLWTAFLVAFPYSARVRGIYLYNEKARGWLSLQFLPAIMMLLPSLRRSLARRHTNCCRWPATT